jgi:hypothetical protein
MKQIIIPSILLLIRVVALFGEPISPLWYCICMLLSEGIPEKIRTLLGIYKIVNYQPITH